MISVIIPCYNISPYIGRCIESVLNQIYQEWELIIIDDGSTDDTGAIIDGYAQTDNRIKVIHKPNGGVSSARNMGLDIARGDYLSFIDGDDWIEPTLYKDAMAAIKTYGSYVFMFEYFIDIGGKSTRHSIAHNFYGLISTEEGLIHSITPDNRFAWSTTI